MAARCPAAFVAHPLAHFPQAYSLILSAKPALLTKALLASPYPPCLQLICLLFNMASLMRLPCHGHQLLLAESLGWEVALKMRNSLAHWLLVLRVDKEITALDIGPDGVRSRSWRPAFSLGLTISARLISWPGKVDVNWLLPRMLYTNSGGCCWTWGDFNMLI